MTQLVLRLGQAARRWAVVLGPLLLQASGSCNTGGGTGYTY